MHNPRHADEPAVRRRVLGEALLGATYECCWPEGCDDDWWEDRATSPWYTGDYETSAWELAAGILSVGITLDVASRASLDAIAPAWSEKRGSLRELGELCQELRGEALATFVALLPRWEGSLTELTEILPTLAPAPG